VECNRATGYAVGERTFTRPAILLRYDVEMVDGDGTEASKSVSSAADRKLMNSQDSQHIESLDGKIESLAQKVEQIYASRTWKILTWLGGIGLLLAGRGTRSPQPEAAPADPGLVALPASNSNTPRGVSGAGLSTPEELRQGEPDYCYAGVGFSIPVPDLKLDGEESPQISVDLRSRVEVHKGSGEWREVRLTQPLAPDQTAILICDMWDKHWCKSATRQVDGLVEKMGPLLEVARQRGMQIIHAASETMEFYKSAPQRKRMLAVGKLEPPLDRWDPPLPIDDQRGCCCDTNDCAGKAWTSEHAGLRMDAADVISDSGAEIYSFLRDRGIRNLLVMGVHSNRCVLNRSFGIKRMTNWGIRCVLVRDLTDAWYSPQSYPFVSHEAGAELVSEYIEKHWCPTTTSAELLRALTL
jgi:nicotinamidase-related amidase